MTSQEQKISRARASLVLGAIGDALGAPVEFMKREEIEKNFGPRATFTYHTAYGIKGPVTDDTQMTLMAADGLVSARERFEARGILGPFHDYTATSYAHWLQAQGNNNTIYGDLSWWGNQDLFEIIKRQGPRAPGLTCINALQKMSKPPVHAQNDSKGCGTVMRVAPVGIFFGNLYGTSPEHLQDIYSQGVEDAALTHGHSVAQDASGVLAVIIALCLNGEVLKTAIESAVKLSKSKEVIVLCQKAMELAGGSPATDAVEELGQGWIAEEALAISLYCALERAADRLTTTEALALATNHSGDSDSTGSITGNLIGVTLGYDAVESELLDTETEVYDLIPMLCSYGEALINT